MLSALLNLCLIAGASAQRPPEYKAKAAVIFKFHRFVEWPAQTLPDSSDAPLIIALIGHGQLADALGEMAAASLGRPIEIVRVKRPDDLPACHILFISASENRRLEHILQIVKDRPILTVSDMEWFARSGGIIRLGIDNERLLMRVNLQAAERAGLRISSRLLRLAEIVGERTPRVNRPPR